MPDLPYPTARQPTAAPVTSVPAEIAYAELHCRTNYSFLRGASHPDELVTRAAELGYRALAITDLQSLAGVVRAHVAARQTGLKLLLGAEAHPRDGSPLLLWAQQRAGYAQLCRLLTLGKRRSEKGDCELYQADIAAHSEGLLAGVLCTQPDDCQSFRYWRERFPGRCYGVVELSRGPDDAAWLQRIIAEAETADVPLVAANAALYHTRSRYPLHDVLTAIRLGRPVADLGAERLPNGERHLQSPAAMLELFASAPELIARTIEVADRCSFSLDELRYDYPAELCPAGATPLTYLTQLTWAGAHERYPTGIPEKVRGLLEHELRLIGTLNYAAYFLTVWDLVRFARSRGILCQGRGSAANSVVCYCLGVTSVDPERIDVLFERFISQERNEAPDIDVDFEHERREEVLQYLYDKYGRERAAMTAEVITYRPRSAVRDVGKALGLSLDRIDCLARSVDHVRESDARLADRFREVGFDPHSRTAQQLLTFVRELLGFPRHLSQHVGGMVLSERPLCELVPIENATMPGRTVIEWNKDDLDALGILKVDCLALGMLTAIRRAFDLIERHTGKSWTLATVPAEDPAVYDMISQADTIGVFQIESRAQMSMLPRLRPRKFYDLVIEVAIVRPGPIQGDMVHPYLRRRAGLEPVEFPNEAVRGVLSKTLGVPLFQEQAMRLVVVAGGFTPGEADQFRRAMGAWRKTGVIDQFRTKLIAGMRSNGYTQEFAERLFQQISGFGEYGFPESHAASFALLVYVSAWIKRFHPAVFLAALLNSQPMGFYAPAQLVSDARQHGITVLPVDVNHSQGECTLESAADQCSSPWAVRLGWNCLRGVSQRSVDRMLTARERGPFVDLRDFQKRTRLSSAVLQKLAAADALQSLGISRREGLWAALLPTTQPGLFQDLIESSPSPALPPLPPSAAVTADYQTAGLSLRGHPLEFVRDQLTRRGIVQTSALKTWPTNKPCQVAGLVLLRQRPSTAKGITFMALEDETGTTNLIVRQEIWERYHRAARRAGALIATGQLQRSDEGIIHLLVERLRDVTEILADLKTSSRDFR